MMLYPIRFLACVCAFQVASAQAQVALTQGDPNPIVGDTSSFVLGPNDQFTIRGVELEEIGDKAFQVGQDGLVTLPLIGTMKAGGLSVREFEAALTTKLSEFIRHPQVSVTVTEYGSQPVSILGSVNNAGVHQLRGSKTLTEALSLAGGLRPDAGYRIKIVRTSQWGTIPLPNVRRDLSGNFSVAEINLKDILDAKNPEENIRICPYDVITVPRAQMIYVVGEVEKSGGFVLNENESLSVLQAVALAGGLRAGAAPKRAKVIQAADGGTKTEIPVDVKKILSGSAQDLPLRADDILFIPLNGPKMAGLRAAEAVITIGTGVVIWRH
jgi:polysaccharide biosynthesis/export protein